MNNEFCTPSISNYYKKQYAAIACKGISPEEMKLWKVEAMHVINSHPEGSTERRVAKEVWQKFSQELQNRPTPS